MMPTSPDETVFAARLTPHRSLSRRGLVLVMALAGGASLLLAVPMSLVGAWPVAGFFGLDIALLYLAFRISNARARACEELVLTRIELLVRRVSHHGRTVEYRFNPLWVRLHKVEHEEFGLQRLTLVEGNKRVEMAAFLGAEEKADFAGALGAALAEARR